MFHIWECLTASWSNNLLCFHTPLSELYRIILHSQLLEIHRSWCNETIICRFTQQKQERVCTSVPFAWVHISCLKFLFPICILPCWDSTVLSWMEIWITMFTLNKRLEMSPSQYIFSSEKPRLINCVGTLQIYHNENEAISWALLFLPPVATPTTCVQKC